MNSIKELSNRSYTNKDFNSIYVELLEYAKKLSYRWDPTASDESDPGVILLKLAAIVGDKDNYNIDKNILELMPVSVTQMSAARQLFDQCGYSMHHYKASNGYVSVKIDNKLGKLDDNDDTQYVYTVPMFTMITDSEQSVVYTTVEDIQISGNQEEQIPVLEGTIAQYTINNDPKITLNNLDNKNRLYFTDYNIAENGIFIKNIGLTNYDEWERVDNLVTQEVGKKCYKFGILTDQSVCYIEFPDDVEFLFGQGVNISYIKTSGSIGSVSGGRLTKLFVDTTFKKSTSGAEEDVSVKTDTKYVDIYNKVAINNGSDPETIDEAYKAYKRVKDTFETLVTLKDYTDYLVTSEEASNGFVCDRTTDIQHSYKILEAANADTLLRSVVETKETKVACETDDGQPATYTKVEPAMLPFDLCVYALQYVANVKDEKSYKDSFQIITGDRYAQVCNDSENGIGSLQHNFIDFDSNRILMLKNKYLLPCTVLPRRALTRNEVFSLKKTLQTALYKTLNSKEMSFGERIDPVKIKEALLAADSRIKDVDNNFSMTSYETYAVYKDTAGKFCELRIDMNSKKPEDAVTGQLWDAFRSEVYAKNILAGVSPLYAKDTEFIYSVNQANTVIYPDIKQISTNTTIKFTRIDSDAGDSAETYTYSSRQVQENESLLLTAPSYVEDQTYATYVKLIYSLSNTVNGSVNANSTYKLGQNDFIIFFWKAANTDTVYQYRKYTGDALANIIKPTFQLPELPAWLKEMNQTSRNNILAHFRDNSKYPINVTGTTSLDSVSALGNVSPTKFVSELTSTSSGEVLTGTDTIVTLKKNKIHINQKTSSGCPYIYWIRNEKVISSTTNNEVYQLFENGTNSYTLKTGEYFVYTNNIKGSYMVLGEGTLLERTGFGNETWEVPVTDTEEFMEDPLNALKDYWKIISLSDSDKDAIYATEMERRLLGPGNSLILTTPDEVSDVSKLSLTSEFKLLGEYKLSYADESGVIHDIPDDAEGWQAATLLNIAVDNDTPQTLTPGQEVIIHYIDPEDADNLLEATLFTEDNTAPINIFGNMNYSHIGDANITVATLDETPLDFLCYNSIESNSNSIRYSNSLFTCEVLPDSDTPEHTQLETFTLLEGEYLLHATYTPLANNAGQKPRLNNITALEDTVEVKQLISNSNVYVLTVSENSDVTLVLDFYLPEGSSNDTFAVIQPLAKFSRDIVNTLPTYCGKQFDELLIEQFEHLDVNRTFDYTSFEYDIENPLDADSFLDPAHVYNPYTICQWYESNRNSDIRVKSNIV